MIIIINKNNMNLDDIMLFNNKTGKDDIYRISGKYFMNQIPEDIIFTFVLYL